MVNVVSDEIEKRGKLGIADLFGLALFAFGDFVQERQDIIWGDFIKDFVAEFLAKFA